MTPDTYANLPACIHGDLLAYNDRLLALFAATPSTAARGMALAIARQYLRRATETNDRAVAEFYRSWATTWTQTAADCAA